MIPGTAPACPTAPRVQEFLHGAEVLPILLADRWVQTGPQPLAAQAAPCRMDGLDRWDAHKIEGHVGKAMK